jgi:hypothetical protein
MARITKLYFRGRKSTSLETTKLVYDPETDDWWFAPVLRDEQDRRRTRMIPAQYAEVKRIIGSGRSS